ncbi:hypothetical protein MRB53_008311 [Persea americana]|uniref:Uncharacterized protein n=1 Tax=Persea americana TaxID=3435 RepID=A0ACC2MM36_PERAE|nr:hypothetical protein MRB53_008311 [Persea americana]
MAAIGSHQHHFCSSESVGTLLSGSTLTKVEQQMGTSTTAIPIAGGGLFGWLDSWSCTGYVQFKQIGSGQIQSGQAPWLCNLCSILWRTTASIDEGYFPSTLDGKLPPQLCHLKPLNWRWLRV